MPVVAFLAPKVEDADDDICILTDIDELPIEILSFIQKRVPTFKLKYSKTAEHKYFANTCPKCGVLSGDFFLHSEPGAHFFPMDDEEAKTLYITEIPLSNSITVKASFHIGIGDLILNHATKV
ncbi:MAG: hypothetical protein ABIK98_06585 [Pseudomonadota bacterium]|uniref:Uncharacterized protein n=1 Tax=Candidatus Desulfatibia profunda TaxID=2841695 RepID=A0A8J6NMZ6_9BACT|nr:hypothetical protein [Candidatus Desulfatibia profunda]MBL7181101.1 hypothetical protein [Desulfobacterales bacterium]MBU0699653.1 hypothetical protein [Pseudomonadota bacterium]